MKITEMTEAAATKALEALTVTKINRIAADLGIAVTGAKAQRIATIAYHAVGRAQDRAVLAGV